MCVPLLQTIAPGNDSEPIMYDDIGPSRTNGQASDPGHEYYGVPPPPGPRLAVYTNVDSNDA